MQLRQDNPSSLKLLIPTDPKAQEMAAASIGALEQRVTERECEHMKLIHNSKFKEYEASATSVTICKHSDIFQCCGSMFSLRYFYISHISSLFNKIPSTYTDHWSH